MHLFLFGAGYSASYLVKALRENPDIDAASITSITGTTRSHEQFNVLREAGISPVLFDATQGFSDELLHALTRATHIISSIAPLTGSADALDPVISLMPQGLRHYAPDARWLSYLSTIGVYGDHQGGWVDEATPVKPLSARSIARVTAENQWQALADQAGIPCAILRIAGIYGPSFHGQGRNALMNLQNNRAHRLIKKDHVFNRIHVVDIGGALAHLSLRSQGGIFNLSDDQPAPAQDVVTYAAQLLGVEPPPAIDFDSAELSPMARSFYLECKRASNQALKDSGYKLRYPDYRTGIDALYASGEGQSIRDQ